MITKKIGIIGAMELEVETLKSKMNVAKTTKKANMEFFEGTLNEALEKAGMRGAVIECINVSTEKSRSL